MIILIVPKQDEGTYYHRLLVPFKHIPNVRTIEILDLEVAEETVGSVSDITQIWFKGNIANDFNNVGVFKVARKAGVKIVMDMDDYWIPPATARNYMQLWEANIPQMLVSQMRMADHITCTHSLLADSIHKIGIPFKKITILPNQIDPTEEQFDREWDYQHEKILWQGSVSHKYDLKQAKEAVQGKDFTIAGFLHTPQWEEIYDLMKPRKVIYSAPVSEYMAAYHRMGICITPLLNNKFNRHKSNIKILEGGYAKKPVLASKVHPYTSIKNVRFAEDWKQDLQYMLDNPSYCEDLRLALHEEVCTNHLANNKTRLDLIDYLNDNTNSPIATTFRKGV